MNTTPTGRVKDAGHIAMMYGSLPQFAARVFRDNPAEFAGFDFAEFEARVLARVHGIAHGIYIGPVERLQGHGALLRNADPVGKIVAQFDDLKRLSHPHCLALSLAHGWHEFDRNDFGSIR